MTKANLRDIYLVRQRNLSPAERFGKSKQISNGFFQAFDLSEVNFLHCFIAIEKFNEIDTKLIFQKMWCAFPCIQMLVPRVNFQTGNIENLKFTPETELVKNAWEIS